MERIIDDSESIRRAEEIYSRKNGINIETNRKKYFSIYKFLFQLIVLINLSICFVVYNNRNFIFSDEFLKQVNEFYNINISDKINAFFNSEDEKNTQKDIEAQNLINDNSNQIKEEENTQDKQNVESKSEIEKIKESYSFIKPIEGTITSFFGNRETKNSKISGYHTGIDIASTSGTKIKSTMDGSIILVSSEGNYGNHLKIKNDDIITLYAHCKSIDVKEGDYVLQGQEIAEVGSTGNSTGPHLHFEIRKNDEYLDPCEFLSF